MSCRAAGASCVKRSTVLLMSDTGNLSLIIGVTTRAMFDLL